MVDGIRGIVLAEIKVRLQFLVLGSKRAAKGPKHRGIGKQGIAQVKSIGPKS